MTVQGEELRRLAALARLRVSDEEAEALGRELSRILGYVDRLQELDAAGIEETASEATDMPRGPEEAPDGPDQLHHPPEAFAPRWEDGFFLVPPPRGVEGS